MCANFLSHFEQLIVFVDVSMLLSIAVRFDLGHYSEKSSDLPLLQQTYVWNITKLAKVAQCQTFYIHLDPSEISGILIFGFC